MSLKGKTLFVTGASRGIGLAIALRAARDGANVAVAAKTDQPHPKLPGTIHTAAAEIEAAGGKALPLMVDVREEDSVMAAVEATVARFGGIDICVNNASAIQLTGTLATDMKRYDLMHQVNARGTFLTSKACLPHLKRAANPHVLALSPPLDMQSALVRPARGLHDGEVRHEHCRPRHGRRIPRRRHRVQRALAAHDHRDLGDPLRPRRRCDDGQVAQPGNHGRRGVRDLQPPCRANAPAISSSTTCCSTTRRARLRPIPHGPDSSSCCRISSCRKAARRPRASASRR